MTREQIKRKVPRKAGFFIALVAVALAVGSTLAVHDPTGPMELDGNIADAAGNGADWESIFNADGTQKATLPTGVFATTGVRDDFVPGASGPDDSYHAPSNKDDQAISGTGGSNVWGCTSVANPTDKTDIVNAYGLVAQGDAQTGDGDTADDQLFYFGVERFDNSGDAFIGTWLFQADVTCNLATGKFEGAKQTGDILILSNFTGGGSNATIQMFRYTAGVGTAAGSFADLVTVTGKCQSSNIGDLAFPQNDICATLNDTNTFTTPWAMEDKVKPGPPTPDPINEVDPDQFVEGGVNLTDIFASAVGGGTPPPCFGSFMAETRSSASIDATLKDFTLGDLNFCDARVTITPTQTNYVGTPHTFLVDVDQKVSAGFTPALVGDVTINLVGANGISNPVAIDAAASTCDDDLDAGPAEDNLNASGQCTIVVNSTVTGTITANVSVAVNLGGTIIVRDTDPSTATVAGPGGSTGPAVKTYVKAKIVLGANDTNEVGDAHTFTATVSLDNGDGTGYQPYPLATVAAVKDSGVGSITGGTCGTTTTNSSGQCTVIVNSSIAGQTVVSASTSFTYQGVAISLSTNGSADNSGPATKKWVDASITIGTTEVNEVGQEHVFTITVTALPGTATPVSFGTITPSVSPTPGTNSNTCATPVVVANVATCTVTINSTTAGVFTANASASITMGGVLVTRDTNPATATIGAGPGGSGPAVKTYVDASIAIGPSEVNEVGEVHVFTVTVTAYPAGTATTFNSITPSVLPVPGTYSDTCGTPVVVANVATCTITINSSSAATFVANASATVTMGGVQVTRDTDPATAGVGSGPSGTGPATKRYVDASVAIAANDTNGIEEEHVFTITVTAHPGSATPVVFTSITVSVAPAPTSQSNTCATPVVVGNVATCTLTINSDVAATYVANAFATVTMGGKAITRDTDPNTLTVDGPSGSGPATKIYLDGTLIWHKVDHNGVPLPGATFEVCRTQRLDTSTNPDEYDDEAAAVCVSVLDDSALDVNKADGEFLLVDLILGTYTVRETEAPTGYTIINALAVSAGSHTILDTELEIVDPFVNKKLFRIIVFTCNDVTDTLVDSTVTLTGEGTVESATVVPAPLLGLGVSETDICTVETGASWGELEEGDYVIDVELPDRAPLFPI